MIERTTSGVNWLARPPLVRRRLRAGVVVRLGARLRVANG